ncbi:bifunctional hydroxymethylpyrimidine kinase/phosphomethylpyrimidine kinase [Phytohalomonas tamaricis]|uniref:bifunctional hydroxymethylpyrimidine kinase/phosphomethylpyrimidine kinase n=1 Tax=Phytohalomonas tamaricis TaxID=2081032 RepID=UPI000D0B83C8|nr:bifunctional hydroxymethylpyrimidine kinase/phosphomethylpyrimidine kinase [Phytohalomonas tamaricis]
MRAPKLLTIAGTDPSGGAGQSADIKTFSALGAYATSVVTAVLAQNTCGVRDILPLPVEMIRAQLDSVFDDITIDAVKIGMIGDLATARVVRDALERYQPRFVILDPVMVAKSGDILVDRDGLRAVREVLIPIADVITPNLPEGAVLLDTDTPESYVEMEAMLPRLAELGAGNVLLKGGHLRDTRADDILWTPQGTHWIGAERIATTRLHGSGCTMASAIAALLPQRDTLLEAVQDAKRYMNEALQQAARLDVGKGKGPAHHFHAWW